jgi:hypothetical protein
MSDFSLAQSVLEIPVLPSPHQMAIQALEEFLADVWAGLAIEEPVVEGVPPLRLKARRKTPPAAQINVKSDVISQGPSLVPVEIPCA